MKRKYSQDLTKPNSKRQASLPSHSLFTLSPELLVHIIEYGNLSLRELQSLKAICNSVPHKRVMSDLEAKKRAFFRDVRLNSQAGTSPNFLFFNTENKNAVLMAGRSLGTWYPPYASPSPPPSSLVTAFSQYTIPSSIQDKMGGIKEIFAGTDVTLLYCDKGIFGLKGPHQTELFQVDTDIIEKQYGKILQFTFKNEAGFFLCEQALLGFGRNQYGQLGLGAEHRQPFGARFNSPAEMFNNIRAIAQENFTSIKQAGNIIKIVNDYSKSMIICEHAIFCCGDTYFNNMGMEGSSLEFKPINFNPSEAGQFIQASIGERHTLMLFKNTSDEYDLYGCGDNLQRQLGEPSKKFQLKAFTMLDYPKDKGNPLMIFADTLNSYILCEEGLFIAGVDAPEWELEPCSSNSSTSDSDDLLAEDSLRPWTSLDKKFKLFREKGEILQIISEVGVLCEKGMFILTSANQQSFLFQEVSIEPECTLEFTDTAETLALKPNP